MWCSGQRIDGPSNGSAPRPWDVHCNPTQMVTSRWPLSDHWVTTELALSDLWMITEWPVSDHLMTSEWPLNDQWVTSIRGTFTVTLRRCFAVKSATWKSRTPPSSRSVKSRHSDRFSSARASNNGGVQKTRYFLALCVDISRYEQSYYVYSSQVALCSFSWHQGRWPWMTLNC